MLNKLQEETCSMLMRLPEETCYMIKRLNEDTCSILMRLHEETCFILTRLHEDTFSILMRLWEETCLLYPGSSPCVLLHPDHQIAFILPHSDSSARCPSVVFLYPAVSVFPRSPPQCVHLVIVCSVLYSHIMHSGSVEP